MLGMERIKSMKWSLSFRIGNVKIFGMIAKIQTVKGLTSEIGKNRHIFIADMENCKLKSCIKSLNETKQYFEKRYKREMSDIYILSDSENSFRVISFTILTLRQLIELLSVTRLVDGLFIFYTALDKKAVSRISNKIGRKFPQDIVYIIKGKETKLPKNIIIRTYETGLEKKGIFMVLGETKVEDLMK